MMWRGSGLAPARASAGGSTWLNSFTRAGAAELSLFSAAQQSKGKVGLRKRGPCGALSLGPGGLQGSWGRREMVDPAGLGVRLRTGPAEL